METVRCGKTRDLPCVKELWAECFGADRFCDWFFARLYDPKYLRVLESDGEIVSMAFCFPRELELSQTTLHAWYLYGIGTRKTARGKGFANRLISACTEEARQCGMDLCFLIPAEQSLFSYYAHCGFTTVWTRKERCGTVRTASSNLLLEPILKDFTKINQIYESAFSARIRRNENDWNLIAEEFRMVDGGFYLLMREETPIGYCGMFRDGKELLIRELGILPSESAEKICDELGFLATVDTWRYTCPGEGMPFAAVLTLKQELCLDGFEVNCDLMYN